MEDSGDGKRRRLGEEDSSQALGLAKRSKRGGKKRTSTRQGSQSQNTATTNTPTINNTTTNNNNPNTNTNTPPNTNTNTNVNGNGQSQGGGDNKTEGRKEDYVHVIPVSRKAAETREEGWHPVLLSKTDKASQMEVSEDRLSVTSRKGYRMCLLCHSITFIATETQPQSGNCFSLRATHGCYEGCWYFEATVEHLGETGHCRLGWATRRGELHAPVGFDRYSFSYRDVQGTKQHKAWREEYGEGYGKDDVIGCLINIPKGGRPLEKKPKDIVKWKGQWYYVDEPEEEPEAVAGSTVGFFRNGKFQGVAYRDFLEGTYCPAVSLYTHPEQSKGANVSFNFGPDFKYPPTEEEGCPATRPVCELAGDPPQPEAKADDPGGGEEMQIEKKE